jgi:hypothetical protein
MRRTVDYRAPDWAMTIEVGGVQTMRFGVSGNQCWRSDRHLVALCSESDRQEMPRIAALQRARLLHDIDPNQVQPAGTVRVEGRDYPAIRTPDLLLAFEPSSHLLAQIRLEDRIDTLSEYKRIGTAQLAMQRVLTVAGAPDVDERWAEVIPGGADPRLLLPPELPQDGLIIDHIDAPRVVAWSEISDPRQEIPAAIARLDAFVRAKGHNLNQSDGLVLTPPNDQSTLWRIAVGIEANTPIHSTVDGAVHIETWPPTRVLGIFHQGDILASDEKREVLRRVLRERSLATFGNGAWQIVVQRQQLDHRKAEQMSFLRIAVQDAGAR